MKLATVQPAKSSRTRNGATHLPVLLVIEDDTATSARRGMPGVVKPVREVIVRLHRVHDDAAELLDETRYVAGALVKSVGRIGRAAVALKLIDAARRKGFTGVVVAGPSYGCNRQFVRGLQERRVPFVVQVRPTTRFSIANRGTRRVRVSGLLRGANWHEVSIRTPNSPAPVTYSAANLASVSTSDGPTTVFAAQPGRISGVHRGTLVGLASESIDLRIVARAACWPGFIRRVLRADSRAAHVDADGAREQKRRSDIRDLLPARANIALAVRQDERSVPAAADGGASVGRGVLAGARNRLRVVELFAGAGGMGLGFLLAGNSRRQYQLVFSGEVHPIYVATLRQNHETFARAGRDRSERVPAETLCVDLRSKRGAEICMSATRDARGADLIIGGPPCQGFSMANRNSGYDANPHNKLVDTFLQYVERLRPPAFLLENVQGILWTSRSTSSARARLGVVEHLARRMARAGYLVFPKLLDAAWYGVPQFRSRFFLLGLHKDLGYAADDFGSWGPFPRPTHGPGAQHPYVTVRSAIEDLPSVPNGHSLSETQYDDRIARAGCNVFLRQMRLGAPQGSISDHVTSRHAAYVLRRYKAIPPGGNWRDIAHHMTNYANVSRTHSNIYRRLRWDEPSITIGHYRKSMIVHPSQDRGLSLREASRLQSFPDWFRFAGNSEGLDGGLVHKQQQLANAVSPLVTRAIATFMLSL